MTAAIGCAFHDAEIHSYTVLRRGFADLVEVAILDRYRLADVVRVQRLLQRRFELRAFGALDPERIAGNKRLAKDGQLGLLVGSLADPFNDFGKRRLAL